MKGKGILAIVSTLAVASLMASMALSNVQIDNDSQIAVVSTENALIQIQDANTSDPTAYYEDNMLKIDFNRGLAEAQGLQRQSQYTWNRLFLVNNHSSSDLNLKIQLTNQSGGDVAIPDGVHFTIWSDEDLDDSVLASPASVDKIFVDNNVNQPASYPFASNTHKPICVRITVDDDAAMGALNDLNIRVIADEAPNTL